MYVDEDQQETVRLGLTAEKVLLLSNFYIGGLPSGEATGALISTTSFYGCIRNMAVDTRWVTETFVLIQNILVKQFYLYLGRQAVLQLVYKTTCFFHCQEVNSKHTTLVLCNVFCLFDFALSLSPAYDVWSAKCSSSSTADLLNYFSPSRELHFMLKQDYC